MKRLFLVGTMVVAFCCGACVVVQPHQRAFLSQRCMRTVADPSEARLDAHVHEYREGSIGGAGVGGGGCGCN